MSREEYWRAWHETTYYIMRGTKHYKDVVCLLSGLGTRLVHINLFCTILPLPTFASRARTLQRMHRRLKAYCPHSSKDNSRQGHNLPRPFLARLKGLGPRLAPFLHGHTQRLLQKIGSNMNRLFKLTKASHLLKSQMLCLQWFEVSLVPVSTHTLVHQRCFHAAALDRHCKKH